MRRQPPCKPDCPKRKPGCHDHCKDYKDWHEALLEDKRKIREAKKLERTLDELLYKERWCEK